MSFIFYLVFILMAYLQPVDAFAPELAPYRLMVLLGLAALIAALFSATGGIASAAKGRPTFLMLALIACIAISQVANGWTGGAIDALSKFSTSIFLFFLTLLNVTSIKRLQITIATIVSATLIISIGGIAGYHFGFMGDRLVMQQRLDENDSNQSAEATSLNTGENSNRSLARVRSLGFLNDPNDMAQAIILALPLILIWNRKNKFIKNAFLYGLFGTVFLYTIFLTHSRGAILGIIFLIFFGIKNKLGTIKTGILAGILLAAAIGINLSGGRGMSMDDESSSNRILAWSEGINMLKQSPLFGVGYGNFIDNNEITAHNSLVLCFAELGLIGCFIWLGLLVIAFQEVNKLTKTSNPGSMEKLYADILRASLAGFLACAFFLSRTYAPLLYLLLGLCFILKHIATQEENLTESYPSRNWVLQTTFIFIGGLALVYLMVRVQHAIG
jgi:hypothetical protein